MPGNAQPALARCPPDPAFSSRHPALRRVFYANAPHGVACTLGRAGNLCRGQGIPPLMGASPIWRDGGVVLLL
jgi:hypothetical protein